MQEDKKMPNITIYLNTELYDFVKAKPSTIIQEALKLYISKANKKNS